MGKFYKNVPTIPDFFLLCESFDRYIDLVIVTLICKIFVEVKKSTLTLVLFHNVSDQILY
jgi:hypothetical protein